MSSSVICRSCGKEVAPGDKFCPGCGTAVGSAHEAAGPEAATVVSHVSLRNAQAARLIDATRGEFEVLEQLGTGAMGAVYLAKDVALGRKVAIKVIAPHLLSDATMVSRFRMEAQTVAALRHPNIVNVHAVKQADDLHYFVMELIDGPPLRNLIKQNAPIDVDVVQSIMFQVGSALSYAHRSSGGVIHRDVKPANIMVDREGDAFVTDFGISKIAESQSGLTQTGATIGTPEYMSPEQCRGEALTGASDQYALGIVAYEMLSGHTPFTGTQYHIMVAHTTEPPPPLREVRPDCPPHVAEAIERMLAKAPAERWPDLDAAVAAMGGAPLGYHDPVRQKIKALTGSTLLHVPAVGAGSGPGGGQATLDTATSVTVLGIPQVLETGERIQLRADVRGAGNTSLGSLGVNWASADPSVAKVEDGWVEGLKPGTVSIMATAGNVASSVVLTVAEATPAKVLVRPSSIRMHRGGRMALTGEVQDKRGRPLERPIRWASSDPKVATVSATGEVNAQGSGPVTIIAESGEVNGTAEVVVEAPAAATASAAAAGKPHVAEPEAAKPKPRPSTSARARRTAPASRPAYRHPAVVAAGLVLLAGAGVFGMRTLGGGAEAVPPAPPSVTGGGSGGGGRDGRGGDGALAPAPSDVGAGTQGSASGQAPPPEPQTQAATGGGTQTPTTGRGQRPAAGRGQGAGRGNSGSSAPAPTPDRVAVGVPERSMQVGGTQTAQARVLAASGAPMDPGAFAVSWQSSDGSVVSVDPQGRLSASSAGQAWIVGNVGPLRDSVLVSVAAAVASLEIGQPDFSVEAGAPPRALSAALLDQASRPISAPVTWTSSNPGVATVDAAGAVRAIAPGTARITASAGGASDQVTVSVTQPAPELPTAREARAAVEAYVAELGGGNRELIARRWGSDDAGRREELLDLFDQNSFSATLSNVGAPTQAQVGAVVPFQVTLSWRTNFGQNRSRDLNFVGRLERVGSVWEIAGARLR